MAEILVDIEEIVTRGDHAHILKWEPLANGDFGSRIEMIGSAKRTVQVTGTFGAGGKLQVEGSIDGTNYTALRDDNGNKLIFKSTGIASVGILTRFIRPRVTAGDGTTALTANLLAKKDHR